MVIEALNSGADFYLQKGGDPTVQFAELEHKVKESVRRSRAERALRENEERLIRAQAIGLMGCWGFQWGSEGSKIWASEEGSRLFGLTTSSDGLLSLDEVEACILEREQVHQALVDLIEKGAKYDLEYEIAPADGGPHRIIHSVAKLVRDYDSSPLKVVGIIQDITERREVGNHIQRLNRELLAIKECNRALIKAQTEQELLDEVCRLVCEVAGYCLAWIGMTPNDEAGSVQKMASFSLEGKLVTSTDFIWADYERFQGPPEVAIRTGRTDYVQDGKADEDKNPCKTTTLKSGFQSWIAIPLKTDENVMGTIMLYSDRANGFDPEEIGLLEELSSDLSFGIVSLRAKEERKKAAEALRESRETYSKLIDSIPNLIVRMDMHGNIDLINSWALRVSGYTPDEVIGKSIFSFIAPEDCERALENITTMTTGLLGPVRYKLVMKNGDFVQFETNGDVLRDSSGSPVGLVLVGRDLTDRVSIDEQLTSTKLTLAIAMDSARLAYWEYDTGTDMYTFNDQFYAMYGTTAGREGGYLMSTKDYYARFVHPDDAVHCREVSAKAPDYHGNNLHIEHRVIRGDGSVMFISVYPCQIKDEHGIAVKVFGVNQDITELKMAEEKLRKANEKLSLLSSITRHDISNQLTIQLGQLALFKGKISDPDIGNRIQKIESSVVTVQKQIEFTGDYEKMGISSPQWQSVTELLDNLPNLKDVGRLEVDESVHGLFVCADPMLHKVFHNLIENSVRYSGKPCAIRIHCETEGEDLLLVYEDVGYGISRDDKDKLFQKGFGKGTGLGLFLSREILAITGIEICESGRPGDGARFEMRVPMGQYRFDRADMAPGCDPITPDWPRQESKSF